MTDERETNMASVDTPPAFHVLVKPRGAICNLDCKYCFFLSKEDLYLDSHFRMTDDMLDNYIRQLIESHRVPEVTIAWQGGEPTLMGLDFYRRAAKVVEKYRQPNMTINYTMQTNGTLLDDEWCEFFHEHKYLIGISIDGPRELHDAYRVDKGGGPTFDRVIGGLDLLRKHEVDWNILCTVHAANGDYPIDVYRFFRDELRAEFVQFIAIVERHNETGFQEGNSVTDRSVKGKQYGNFLKSVFDEWVTGDVGRVFVQIFDVALAAWAGAPPPVCVFSPTCGNALALEHTGDLYSCDHFVEPNYHLGSILDTPLPELVGSEFQRKFGLDKRDTLPRYCRECEVRFVCHGGCPKNRFIRTPDGMPGLNYLCGGYKAFFSHIDLPMRIMATLLRQRRAPAEVMQILPVEEARRQTAFAKAKRNDPCPCGSGRKFRHCHGRRSRPQSSGAG